MKRILFFAWLVLMMIACQPGHRQQDSQGEDIIPSNAQELALQYAKGFRIYQDGSEYYLVIADPWQQARHIKLYYHLHPKGNTPSITESTISHIPIPVTRIACMSTTHLGFLDKLGCSDNVIAFSGVRFVYQEALTRRIAAGEITELGYEQSLNYEKLVHLAPDVLINYGVTSEISGVSEKLSKLGIPHLLSAEYLEEHPLGKAEWIKVFGLLTNQYEKADSIFRKIENKYLKLQELASSLPHKPLVMTGLPWKDAWYLTGQNSYLPQFISDAGGIYFNSQSQNREPLALSIEAVYSFGHEASYWINAGDALNLSAIQSLDNRLSDFKPFRDKKIYNNNRRLNVQGGNDYFEGGTVEPDIILQEIIQILHPGLISPETWKYYQVLQ